MYSSICTKTCIKCDLGENWTIHELVVKKLHSIGICLKLPKNIFENQLLYYHYFCFILLLCLMTESYVSHKLFTARRMDTHASAFQILMMFNIIPIFFYQSIVIIKIRNTGCYIGHIYQISVFQYLFLVQTFIVAIHLGHIECLVFKFPFPSTSQNLYKQGHLLPLFTSFQRSVWLTNR